MSVTEGNTGTTPAAFTLSLSAASTSTVTVNYSTTTGFRSGAGIRPFDARLDPSGAYLFVVDAALNAVSAFAVDGGTLLELPGSPFALPAGATPFGIAVD